MQLPLLVDNLMHASHRHRVERFYGVYKPVEGRLPNGCDPITPWIAVKQRHKTPHLDAHLTALGHQAIDRLPLCTHVQSLISTAECFGCLYVLEGAILGAIVIDRHVEQKPGVTPATGGRFLNAHGENTDSMWHQFRDAIPAFSLHSDQQAMVGASALATFATLHHWCEKGAEQ